MSETETDVAHTRGSHFRPCYFVTPRVTALQERFLNGEAGARAVLSQLRAAASGDPGAAWGISEYLIPERDYHPGSLRSDVENSASADRAETAIHIAMTSYASLQQAGDKPMHVKGRSLGTAARLLGAHPDESMDRGKVWARLSKLAQAQSVSGLQWQLRGLTSLLKRRGIGLDIGQLADDLYFWQFPSSRTTVQRSWSRAFFSSDRATTEDSVEATDSSAT